MAFKIGQKIVCVGEFPNGDGKEPKIGEIVTCVGNCLVYSNNIDLAEYPLDANGNNQSFRAYFFRPLDEILTEINIEAEVQECLTREFQTI